MTLGRYILAPAAEDDLRRIGRHYLKEGGRTVAAGVLRGIRARCELLAETPGRIGHPRDELGPGVRSFPVSPHVVFFRYAGELVEVVRVLHEKQDVEARFGS